MSRHRSASILALAALLSACALQAPQPPREPLPPAPLVRSGGFADPTQQVVLGAAYVFGDPRRVAGRPADAARAAAQLGWLTLALPQDPRWIPATATLFGELRRAEAEMRQTLGLSPDASVGTVTRALTAAADALDQGDRAGALAALAPIAPGGAAGVLAKLGAMPPMPRAAVATQTAAQESFRIMMGDPE